MSRPILFCEIRKAIDTNNWKLIDRKMSFNKKWGAYSILPCSCGKCKPLTKLESKQVDSHLDFEPNKGNRILAEMRKRMKCPICNKKMVEVGFGKMPLIDNGSFQKYYTKEQLGLSDFKMMHCTDCDIYKDKEED